MAPRPLLFFVFVFLCWQRAQCQESNVCKNRVCYYSPERCPPNDCYYDPEVNLDVPALINHNGYDVLEYQTITSDGYILTLFRIPNSEQKKKKHNKNKKNKKRPPVLLVHLALGSAASYVVSKKESLAFRLADEGYDVWLANLRGSEYSQGHLKYSVENNTYWDYTIHEMARYDIPAYLSTIEHNTGKTGVIYVGHSISTAMVMAYATLKPEEAKARIRLAVLLSQTVEVRNSRVYAQKIMYGKLGSKMWRLIRALHINKYLSAYKYSHPPFEALTKMIGVPSVFDNFVNQFGPNDKIPIERAPIFLHNENVGLSMKAYIHSVQFTVSDFARFDYGGAENRFRYGTDKPPVYDVTKIKMAVYMVNAPDDYMAVEEDCQLLYDKLPVEAKRYGAYTVPLRGFNHLAYAYGHARVLYDHLIEFFAEIK